MENDIVDDKVVKLEIKQEVSDQDMNLMHDPDEDGDTVLSTSFTRSGRLSRPPRTIVPNLTSVASATVGSILDLPNLPPPPPPPAPTSELLKNIEPKVRIF